MSMRILNSELDGRFSFAPEECCNAKSCQQFTRQTWPLLFAVWATFLVYGAIAAPIPGVNEPHYLCKAKHYWQPEWCSQDFFLASPNAHTVFYSTIGYFTSIVSFPQAAWIGRILALLVLAWGWNRVFTCLLMTAWGPLWCVWLFLALEACGNFSGEWLVGGVEGKVVSYGLLLAALGDSLRHRRFPAAIWAGLAISFHPVVGIWGVFAFLASRIPPFIFVSGQTHTLRTIIANLFKCVTAAMPQGLVIAIIGLPGLIPVVRLLAESVSAETRYAATYLQVYFRLAHHLDPMLFPLRAWLGYAGLLVVWIANLRWSGRTNSKRDFDRMVFWAVLFAITGIVIGYGPRPPNLMPYFEERMHLLKFYPFRLADLLLPIAVSVSLVSVLERTLLTDSVGQRQWPFFSVPRLLLLLVYLGSLWHAHSNSDRNWYSQEDRADWLNICEWIDEHLPVDAVVQSPTNGWAFKWFAHRAEYVAFKDCPQDAAGIVEWNRRLNFLQKWFEQNYADELYSAVELRDLRRQTGITHLLTDRLGPLELEPVYRNGTFQVYNLKSLDR